MDNSIKPQRPERTFAFNAKGFSDLSSVVARNCEVLQNLVISVAEIAQGLRTLQFSQNLSSGGTPLLPGGPLGAPALPMPRWQEESRGSLTHLPTRGEWTDEPAHQEPVLDEFKHTREDPSYQKTDPARPPKPRQEVRPESLPFSKRKSSQGGPSGSASTLSNEGRKASKKARDAVKNRDLDSWKRAIARLLHIEVRRTETAPEAYFGARPSRAGPRERWEKLRLLAANSEEAWNLQPFPGDRTGLEGLHKEWDTRARAIAP
jgi:hypothetical protein